MKIKNVKPVEPPYVSCYLNSGRCYQERTLGAMGGMVSHAFLDGTEHRAD